MNSMKTSTKRQKMQLELKIKITEIKNKLKGLNSRLEYIEEQVNDWQIGR